MRNIAAPIVPRTRNRQTDRRERLVCCLARQRRKRSKGLTITVPCTEWHSLHSTRTQRFFQLWGDHATLAEIGQAFDRTAEWARQKLKFLRRFHGAETVEQFRRWWSVPEVSLETGVAERIVRGLCGHNLVPCRYRDMDRRRSYFLNRAGIQEVRRLGTPPWQRACAVCDKTIKLVSPFDSRLTCSPRCRRTRIQENQIRRGARPVTSEPRALWCKKVARALNGHIPPDGDEWLGLSAAARRAGLQKIQIDWLRKWGILTTKPHPSQKWRRKQPVRLYAASQLDIVRRMYENRTTASHD